MNKLATALTVIGKGKSFHRALITNDTPDTANLCGREWTDRVKGEAQLVTLSECKQCAKKWSEMLAEELRRQDRDRAENDRSTLADQRWLTPDEIHEVNSIMDPDYACHGELVWFNGREYEINFTQRDEYRPRDTDSDWLILRATDGSGSVTIQRFDLDPFEPEFLTVGSDEIAPEPVSLVKPYAPVWSIPTPRKPFTPLDMDALNLRRRLGAKVRVQGSTGFGRILTVHPRQELKPGVFTKPSVTVVWWDGVKTKCALSEILLAG